MGEAFTAVKTLTGLSFSPNALRYPPKRTLCSHEVRLLREKNITVTMEYLKGLTPHPAAEKLRANFAADRLPSKKLLQLKLTT